MLRVDTLQIARPEASTLSATWWTATTSVPTRIAGSILIESALLRDTRLVQWAMPTSRESAPLSVAAGSALVS